jgi:hypothetical protein
MPFGRTWSEELVAEILELKGYHTTIGVTAGSGQGGGRKDADVVGVRHGGREVVHAEVSQGYQTAGEIVKNAKGKFTKDRTKHVLKELGIRGPVASYTKLFVRPALDGKGADLKQKLSRADIEFLGAQGLIEEIKQTVDTWTENHRTTKNPDPALPESHWLLKTAEFVLGI